MSRNYLILLAVIIFPGCAYPPHPRTFGTAKEQQLIQPDQKITILWDVYTYCGPSNNCQMADGSIYSNIYSKQYETCTNAYFERTFYQNGYNAKVIKVNKAELNAAPIDSRYVLVLHNNRNLVYASPGRMSTLVQINLESKLYDNKSGHLLWQGEGLLLPNAKRNFLISIAFVRAFAEDVFLNRKIKDVVDYQGLQHEKDMDIPEGCPE